MKSTKVLVLSASLSAMTLAVCSSALADMTNKSLILDAQAGPGILSDSGGTHLQWGGEVLYNLLGPISVGAFINYMGRGKLTDPATGTTLSASYLWYGGQAMYDTGSLLANSSIGARIGLARSGNTRTPAGGTDQNLDNTNFSIGPVVEYDVPIAANMSLGGLLNYQVSSGDNTNNDVAILLAFKYYL